jgi:DNA-binding LytR/AlgR family response regulator
MVSVSVLVVEDEPRTRERLAGIVTAHPGWRLTGSCGSLQAARDALDQQRPDVLLLDLGLPDGTVAAIETNAQDWRLASGVSGQRGILLATPAMLPLPESLFADGFE